MFAPALTAAFATLVDEFAELVAHKVYTRLQQGTPGMVDQSNSPLGRRRHCSAVRRRQAEGKPGAAVVGRRHLLTREALAEELARLGKHHEQRHEPAKPGSVADELRRELAELDRLRQSGMSERDITSVALGRSPGKRPRPPPKR